VSEAPEAPDHEREGAAPEVATAENDPALRARRRRRRRRRDTPTSPITALTVQIPPDLRRYTTDVSRWRDGNRIKMLVSGGETFPAMLSAIAAAKHSICLETYILEDDRTGERFAAAMIERATAGVAVRLLYDAVGGFGVSDEYVARLEAAGIEVRVFHPIAPWRQRWSLARRNHRKILVVDDEVGFTGGLNISDDYASVEDGGKGWRDTHCELHGPIVADLARSFRRNWLYTGGKAYPSPLPAEKMQRLGSATLARLLDNTQRKRRRRIRRAYLAAINAAMSRVLIENAYFLPDRGVRNALRRAVARGVDVRVLAPGRSDVRLIELASLLVFRRLVRSGVKILRWRGVMMHCKTAVIDGVWSTIGSYNLDYISLLYNLEETVETLDAEHGAVMVKQFELDIANADLWTEASWQALPWYKKAAAWLAYQIRRWL
jgi:cardiolipin synthase